MPFPLALKKMKNEKVLIKPTRVDVKYEFIE